ncbi:hypothetical protein BBP40_007163 [Aspergillus hancockii]|nr:hypothetical protein BBP40_007163 [Aspergillus hancockii]
MSEKFKTQANKQDDDVDPDTLRGRDERCQNKYLKQVRYLWLYWRPHFDTEMNTLVDTEFVTGISKMACCYVETGHLLDLELDSCRAWIQRTTSVTEAPESLTVKKIAENSARQLHVLGQMHRERVRWLSAQDDQKLVDEGITTEQAHIKQRKWQLFKLAGIGQLEDAVTLAEKFRDMSALVELVIELQDQTKGEISSHVNLGGTPDAIKYDTEHLSQKISLYFEKFGESWADAFFSRQISMHQSGILFAMRKFQPFITQFLRKDAAYSRLGWINDVIGENDYNTAAQSLEKLAIGGESDLWSHRVQLSLAKLAKIATLEKISAPRHSTFHNDIRHLEDLSEIDAVQEVIYAYISPALQGAIDQKAEIDLAIDQFGKWIAKDRPSLHEILSETLTRVVTRQIIDVDQLVDLLTLMNSGEASEHGLSEDTNDASLYIPGSPHDVFLSGSDLELLSGRFRPEQRARIIHDLERENAILHQHVDQGKLDFWFKNILASAENASTPITSLALEDPSHNKQIEEQPPPQTERSSTKARLNWL